MYLGTPIYLETPVRESTYAVATDEVQIMKWEEDKSCPQYTPESSYAHRSTWAARHQNVKIWRRICAVLRSADGTQEYVDDVEAFYEDWTIFFQEMGLIGIDTRPAGFDRHDGFVPGWRPSASCY